MTNKEKLALLAVRKAGLELQLTIVKMTIKSIEKRLKKGK